MELTNQYLEPIKGQQPLPVDPLEAQETASKSQTLTYTGKGAAAAVATVETTFKPIAGIESGRVGSYWGNLENLVWDTVNRASKAQIISLTETNGSAAVVVRDDELNLENLFESLTTTVKRYIVKCTDNTGAVLYGWIFGVAASANQYTIDAVNNRVTETQNWVGTLGSFDNANVARVQIFRYDSSLSFGTATTFTEEVAHPKEYSTGDPNSGKIAMTKMINGLSNGQYFVDYMRGELIGKRADGTASETITYNVFKSTASGGTAASSNLEEINGTPVNEGGVAGSLGVGGNVAHDAVDAGNPVKIGGYATSSQRTAVASGDRVDAAYSLYGEAIIAGYTYNTNSIRTEEIDPLSQHFVTETLAELTNIATNTTAYLYTDWNGYRYGNFQNETSGITPTDTLTLTLEGSVQDDGTASASCTYQDVTNELTGTASYVDTDCMWILDTPLAFKYLRLKYVTSNDSGADADLTTYHKRMY